MHTVQNVCGCSDVIWPYTIIIIALRKVTKLSSNVEGKLERKSVINQYSNFDSQVYAPMTRIGVYLDSGSEQYNVKSHLTTTLDGESQTSCMYYSVVDAITIQIEHVITYSRAKLKSTDFFLCFRSVRVGRNSTSLCPEHKV